MTLFGLGWPAPHRVVANVATRRWCRDDGRARLVPRLINAGQPHAGQPPGRSDHARDENADAAADVLPIAQPIGMPDSPVDRTALYAGETVLRMTSVISARQAVTDLTPR